MPHRTAPNTAPLLTLFPGFAGQKASVSTSDGQRSRGEPCAMTPGGLQTACRPLVFLWLQHPAVLPVQGASHASLTLEACACRHAQELTLCDASLYNAALV